MFLDSFKTIFAKVFNCKLKRGPISIWSNCLAENEIAILTGITGSRYTGIVVYSMKDQTATQMVEYLDPDLETSDENGTFYSSLGELVNIISGNVMTYFSQKKIDLAITTPSVVVGNAFEMYLLNQTTFAVEMLSSFGAIEIDIAIKRF
jgi:chemotaxis protein CheX